MAYTGKTNWQINDIVMPGDMNRIEQGIINAHENLLTHNADDSAHEVAFDAHNADTGSHTDIRNKIGTDISSHNISTSAHTDIRNKIQTVQQNASLFMLPVKRNTAYVVGDCASAAGLPSWAYLECITAGTTAEIEQDFGGGRASDHLTDGTAVFIVRDMRCKYRTGQIVPLWSTPAEYDYLLLCDGSQISAELYPELVKVLGGNTLPDLVGRFLEGAGSAGEYKEAGLPNIRGGMSCPVDSYSAVCGYANKFTGAFKNTKSQGVASIYSTNPGYSLDFDASKSNPIYGSSTTVQPKSMTVKYYICYAG